MILVNMLWLKSLEDINVWSWWILFNSCFFDIFFLNILRTVAQTPIKQYFLKDYSEVFLMNLNKLLRLRSLAEVSAILQEMRYFGQFKDHLTTFRALIACDIHFCIWELSKFIFVGPPFGLFWSPKYLNFGGESCEIRILSRSIQETYTLGKVKNQVLLFLSS